MRLNHPILVSTFFALTLGCASETSGPGSASRPAAWSTPVQTPSPKEDPKTFVVHEWGTYTSMQTPDGQTLPGFYEEDEPLPAFVHHNAYPSQSGTQTKSIPTIMVREVTQKLETPVIYFHGDTPRNVEVQVDFPAGVLSEWYPQASSVSPKPQDFDVRSDLRQLRGGSMTWNAELLERPARTIPVRPEDIWAPSRQVDARTVKVGDEEEPFIFYRGLGTFEMPVRVESLEGGGVRVTNASEVRLEHVFVLTRKDTRGAITRLEAMGPGEQREVSPQTLQQGYVKGAQQMIVDALTQEKLFQDESWAMVRTWERSYFETQGTRVLYLAPRAWTDALLPLRVTPTPDRVERVLIGRIEVLTRTEETALDTALDLALTSDKARSELLTTFTRGKDLSQYGRSIYPRLIHAKRSSETPQRTQLLEALLRQLDPSHVSGPQP